jgi:hypothetical protein
MGPNQWMRWCKQTRQRCANGVGLLWRAILNRTRRDNREVGSRCGAMCTRVENDDLGGFLYSFGFRVVKDHRYQVKSFFNSIRNSSLVCNALVFNVIMTKQPKRQYPASEMLTLKYTYTTFTCTLLGQLFIVPVQRSRH